MIPVLVILGGQILRIGSQVLLKQAMKSGAKRYAGSMVKNVTKKGIISGTAKNIAQFGKSGGPKFRNPRGKPTTKVSSPPPTGSRISNTSTSKGGNAKITKPPSKTSNTSTSKGGNAKITKPPSKTSNTSTSKGGNAKITKPPSKTSNTSTSKGGNAKFGGKDPLIVGSGLGLLGVGLALNDKDKKPDSTTGSRTVKTREGKDSVPKPTKAKKGDNVGAIPATGPSKDESFGKAFKRNRSNRQATFTYKDKLYTTRIKEETIADHKKKFKVKGDYK